MAQFLISNIVAPLAVGVLLYLFGKVGDCWLDSQTPSKHDKKKRH
ncbi:MAG: hypothetical protein ACI31W_00710 [Lactococcus sp.]